MNSTIGVDLGEGTIKLVTLSKDNAGLVLNSLSEIKNPRPDWLKAGNDKYGSEIAKTIKSLMDEAKLKTKQAVVCIPEGEVISRLIRLPPLKENEIMDALKFEAETFIPYPLDQVSIDYEIIEEDDAGRLSIFVIAAQNSLIQNYIKLFKSIGLELFAIETTAVSLARVVTSSMALVKGVVVVDMGEKHSEIVGIDNGKVYFTRSMMVGGESLTRAISLNLGLDMASAEEYKKAYGMKELELEGKIKNAISPIFANMAEEIRKSLALFAEEQKKAAELLVLSGGGANLPGLAEELTKLLGIEVQVIQPFLKVDLKQVQLPINLNVEGCRFSVATGLAMRGTL